MKESNFLVLVRHGQSEWNAKNLFTGWKDPGLTEKGSKEAMSAGAQIKEREIDFSVMYTSVLMRAQITGQSILEVIGQTNIPVIKDQALNERDYGDLAGLNKDDARKQWEVLSFLIIHRVFVLPHPMGY